MYKRQLLASGEFHVMAAVMAGGMVPPLAIALCTTFFKNRFTESERKAGVTNYVMGLSFITEGAIPFAAACLLYTSLEKERKRAALGRSFFSREVVWACLLYTSRCV